MGKCFDGQSLNGHPVGTVGHHVYTLSLSNFRSFDTVNLNLPNFQFFCKFILSDIEGDSGASGVRVIF